MAKKSVRIWTDRKSYETILNNRENMTSLIVEAKGYPPMEFILKKEDKSNEKNNP